jgi:hypothetical protein
VIRALGIEDVIQCVCPYTWHAPGSSDRWPGGVDLFSGSFLPAFVWLLVRAPSWCRWYGFCTSDEVMGPLIYGDVDVRLPKQLFGGGRCRLKYGLDNGQVVGSR